MCIIWQFVILLVYMFLDEQIHLKRYSSSVNMKSRRVAKKLRVCGYTTNEEGLPYVKSIVIEEGFNF